MSPHYEEGSEKSTLTLIYIVISWQAFGGYLTLKMLAGTNQLFKCGVAVAPITDFKLYSEPSLCFAPVRSVAYWYDRSLPFALTSLPFSRLLELFDREDIQPTSAIIRLSACLWWQMEGQRDSKWKLPEIQKGYPLQQNPETESCYYWVITVLFSVFSLRNTIFTCLINVKRSITALLFW